MWNGIIMFLITFGRGDINLSDDRITELTSYIKFPLFAIFLYKQFIDFKLIFCHFLISSFIHKKY